MVLTRRPRRPLLDYMVSLLLVILNLTLGSGGVGLIALAATGLASHTSTW